MNENTISYETQTVVRLDKKIVGQILECPNGFYFKLKGRKDRGDFFPTLAQCKQSLEVSDEH